MEKIQDYYNLLRFEVIGVSVRACIAKLRLNNNFTMSVYRVGSSEGIHGLSVNKGSESYEYIPAYPQRRGGMSPNMINRMASFLDSCDSEVPKEYVRFILRSIYRSEG